MAEREEHVAYEYIDSILAEVEQRIEAWALWQDNQNVNIERGFAFGVAVVTDIIRNMRDEYSQR